MSDALGARNRSSTFGPESAVHLRGHTLWIWLERDDAIDDLRQRKGLEPQVGANIHSRSAAWEQLL